MGLLPSEVNTAILTIIVRFSKMVHFVDMLKLPPACIVSPVTLFLTGVFNSSPVFERSSANWLGLQ